MDDACLQTAGDQFSQVYSASIKAPSYAKLSKALHRPAFTSKLIHLSVHLLLRSQRVASSVQTTTNVSTSFLTRRKDGAGLWDSFGVI